MSLKGKYDFPGIRRAGQIAFAAALATVPWGAALLKGPFKPVAEYAIGFLTEWLANRGLLVINIGAIYLDTKFDQVAFDRAMEKALDQVKMPGLTDEQKKAIDHDVIKAFRNFARVSKSDSV